MGDHEGLQLSTVGYNSQLQGYQLKAVNGDCCVIVVCPFYLRYHIPIPSARWFLVDPLGLYLPTSHDHHEHHPLGPKPGASCDGRGNQVTSPSFYFAILRQFYTAGLDKRAVAKNFVGKKELLTDDSRIDRYRLIQIGYMICISSQILGRPCFLLTAEALSILPLQALWRAWQ